MNNKGRLRERIPIETARSSLATIWFSGAGIPFVLLATQSMLGKYHDSLQEIWGWFVPTVFPTLALMLGVIGATALQDEQDKRAVKKFFFVLSRGLSLFYLAILLLTMLMEPFSNLKGLKLFTVANYWLSPLQGLVIASIAVLFTSQEKLPR